jgi:anhydro-N-acetylmuramic acid kinase
MLKTALGIMTGTSCDGINLGLVHTDGENIIERLKFIEEPFAPELSLRLKQAGQQAHQTETVDLQSDDLIKLATDYTKTIIESVCNHFDVSKIDLIGFHGQTILHRPDKGFSIQIGLPQLLADATHTDVVFNFRQSDIKHGGQGAPLVPLYHQACVQHLPQPVVFINIGGVANVTYCKNPIIGFDIGTGNCVGDDLCQEFFNIPYDKNGAIAASGQVNYDIAHEIAQTDIFLTKPPKSFDRNQFDISLLKTLSPIDAIATANYLSAYCIVQADKFYPEKPKMRIISGGGVYNKTMIHHLERLSDIPVITADNIGLNSNAIEAECFAWLAVRSIRGLHLSLPSVTGVSYAVSGGELFKHY